MLNDLNRESRFVNFEMKFITFTFADNEFVINNSFNIVDLSSLKMNFDFSFIFIFTIFDSLRE